MIAATTLAALAALLGTVGARIMQRARWTRRAPRLGILAWQALSFSVALSLVLAGLSLTLPSAPAVLTDGVAGFFGACAIALREHYSSPGGVAVGLIAGGLSLWVVCRCIRSVSRELLEVRQSRQRRRDAINLVGRGDILPGVTVVHEPRPAAYCIPGFRPTVVLTTGALGVLSDAERDVVLSHERAHLSARHDLALIVARGLRDAIPVIPVFATALDEIASLVEMHADDRALRSGDRVTLATALVRLAAGPCPAGTLGATGGDATQRLSRILAMPNELTRRGRWIASVGILLVATAPVLLAVAPGLEALIADYCPVNRHACDVVALAGSGT